MLHRARETVTRAGPAQTAADLRDRASRSAIGTLSAVGNVTVVAHSCTEGLIEDRLTFSVSGQPFLRIQACRRPCGVRASPLAVAWHHPDWLAVWLSGPRPAEGMPRDGLA